MRRFLALVAAVVALSSPTFAQQPATHATLFDHLAGRWVLRGTIDNKQTTHDVDAQFVLNGGYIRLHEVSREKDAKGKPAYEAIVFISLDKKSGEYKVLWLDTTGNGGLSADAIGRATPSGNSLPFLFKTGSGDVFHTTFIYTPTTDSWQWAMDGESGGRLQPFARVTLNKSRQ
ncbi:MAG: hypothetical protein NTV05_06245 [Acidobacteria bacterium]|nr:hypothetical protein [Acidobacteriota bacterium]